MITQEIRDEIARSRLLSQGLRLVDEIARFKRGCIAAGYHEENLDKVRLDLYDYVEKFVPPKAVKSA